MNQPTDEALLKRAYLLLQKRPTTISTSTWLKDYRERERQHAKTQQQLELWNERRESSDQTGE
jgi:hypothetical protein